MNGANLVDEFKMVKKKKKKHVKHLDRFDEKFEKDELFFRTHCTISFDTLVIPVLGESSESRVVRARNSDCDETTVGNRGRSHGNDRRERALLILFCFLSIRVFAAPAFAAVTSVESVCLVTTEFVRLSTAYNL